MRAPGTFALVAVAALAVQGAAHAAPAGDAVTGGAQDFTGAHVSVAARSGPSGEEPTGHINATLPAPLSPTGGTLQFRLRVTCLAVAGNTASIGAVTTTSPSNDVPAGTPFVVTVLDSGAPGGDGDLMDVLPGEAAETCATFLPSAAVAPPVDEGNLHVRDTS